MLKIYTTEYLFRVPG